MNATCFLNVFFVLYVYSAAYLVMLDISRHKENLTEIAHERSKTSFISLLVIRSNVDLKCIGEFRLWLGWVN